jgi:hypothetical protein
MSETLAYNNTVRLSPLSPWRSHAQFQVQRSQPTSTCTWSTGPASLSLMATDSSCGPQQPAPHACMSLLPACLLLGMPAGSRETQCTGPIASMSCRRALYTQHSAMAGTQKHPDCLAVDTRKFPPGPCCIGLQPAAPHICPLPPDAVQ